MSVSKAEEKLERLFGEDRSARFHPVRNGAYRAFLVAFQGPPAARRLHGSIATQPVGDFDLPLKEVTS